MCSTILSFALMALEIVPMDLLYIGVMILFWTSSWALLRLCERLSGEGK
jgi:hypothetical protein